MGKYFVYLLGLLKVVGVGINFLYNGYENFIGVFFDL